MEDTRNEEKLIPEDIEDEYEDQHYDEYDEDDDEYDDEYDDEEDDEYDDEYDDEEDDEYVEEVAVKDETSEEDLIIQDMADFLKIFGDYSRIKIMENIMDIRYTVGDLAVFTGLTQSAVSHHLRILKQAKMVVGVKSGKYVYYRVADKHIRELYNLTRTHIEEFKKTISAKEESDEMAEIFYRELYAEK